MKQIVLFCLFAFFFSCEESSYNQTDNAVTGTSMQEAILTVANNRPKNLFCNDPRFIKAEQEAYNSLLNEIAKIIAKKKEQIDKMDRIMKAAFDSVDIFYQRALHQCGNEHVCTEKARQDRNEAMQAMNLTKDEWKKNSDQSEAKEMEKSYMDYDHRVEEYRKLYCKGFRANGTYQDSAFSGHIDDLSKMFTIKVSDTVTGIEWDIQCTPMNNSTGTWVSGFSYGGISHSASGNYTIDGLNSAKTVFKMSGNWGYTVLGVTTSASGTIPIDLIRE